MPLKRDKDKKATPRVTVYPEVGCRLSVGSAIDTEAKDVSESTVTPAVKRDRSPSKTRKIKPTFRFPKKDIFPKSKEKEEKKDKESRKGEDKKKEDKEGKKEKHKLKDKKKPKHREVTVATKVQGIPDKPVFSVPLAVAVERSKCHDGIELPAIFRECIDYIEEHGLNCEGIYRISGVKSKVQQLKECYNKSLPAYLYEHEPNVVASLLKQFLRELPEPVLTTSLMPKFEEASTLKTEAKRLEAFRKLMEDLPVCNRLLLSWMIVHMTHIIQHQAQNKMSLQNVSIVLSPTMQISHRVLNIFFSLAMKLFGDTQIKKYVPPLRPATSRWSLELPDSLSALEEELAKQESLLNALHEELKTGVEDTSKEEQLWEVQRVVTQLKRKIKFAQKATDVAGRRKQELESKKPQMVSELDELNLELQPVTEAKEEEVPQVEETVTSEKLEEEKKQEQTTAVVESVEKPSEAPAMEAPETTRTAEKTAEVTVHVTEEQVKPEAGEIPRLEPPPENTQPEEPRKPEPQITISPDTTAAEPTKDQSKSNEVDTFKPNDLAETKIKPEQVQPSPVKPSGPIQPHLQISQELLQPIKVSPQNLQERSSTLESSDSVDAEKTARSTSDGDQAVDEETKKLLEEEYAMTLEEEELLAIGDELKQKIETEQSEIERLKQEIVELQYLRQDSDLEDYSSTSESSDESEGEEELTELLNSLIAENEELERKNSELCQKIHDERVACLDCKVSIRLIQQKQLDSDNILDRDNPI